MADDLAAAQIVQRRVDLRERAGGKWNRQRALAADQVEQFIDLTGDFLGQGD